MTIERAARALAAAYNFDPDELVSPDSFDASPAMQAPNPKGYVPSWQRFSDTVMRSLAKAIDGYRTFSDNEEGRIFEALQQAGLVEDLGSEDGAIEWKLTAEGVEAAKGGAPEQG